MWTARPASPRRAIAAVIIGPGIATAIALAASRIGAVGAASMYLLAVVAVAAAGGVWSGVAAAIASFLGLNYFFTPPKHTFTVGKIAAGERDAPPELDQQPASHRGVATACA